MSGRDRNRSIDMGPDKTDSDWRARPSVDMDEGPRRDDAYGERENILFQLPNKFCFSCVQLYCSYLVANYFFLL